MEHYDLIFPPGSECDMTSQPSTSVMIPNVLVCFNLHIRKERRGLSGIHILYLFAICITMVFFGMCILRMRKKVRTIRS